MKITKNKIKQDKSNQFQELFCTDKILAKTLYKNYRNFAKSSFIAGIDFMHANVFSIPHIKTSLNINPLFYDFSKNYSKLTHGLDF